LVPPQRASRRLSDPSSQGALIRMDFSLQLLFTGAVYALVARYVLEPGGVGFVRTKTLKAFPETTYREIIRSLG
jgi:hypothetical protein